MYMMPKRPSCVQFYPRLFLLILSIISATRRLASSSKSGPVDVLVLFVRFRDYRERKCADTIGTVLVPWACQPISNAKI